MVSEAIDADEHSVLRDLKKVSSAELVVEGVVRVLVVVTLVPEVVVALCHCQSLIKLSQT